MVTVRFTKPFLLNKKEYKKGEEINVYEPLRAELVDKEKVAIEVTKTKVTKATKEKGE